MQQWEYSCIVSEANLELPHLKAEAMSSTKANSVIETLHSAWQAQPAILHVTPLVAALITWHGMVFKRLMAEW